jgi:beta-glucosidase
LSYSDFQLSNLRADVDDSGVRVRFVVRNTGDRAGKYVAQLYVSPVGDVTALGWEAPKRLCGFRKVSLQRGQSGEVSLLIEPRMLAVYDNKAKHWVIEEADYDFALSADSRHTHAHVKVHVPRRVL